MHGDRCVNHEPSAAAAAVHARRRLIRSHSHTYRWHVNLAIVYIIFVHILPYTVYNIRTQVGLIEKKCMD